MRLLFIFLLLTGPLGYGQEHGLVYFYRAAKGYSPKITIGVFDDTVTVGSLAQGQVLAYFAPAGRQHFFAGKPAQDTITVSVAPGKVHFVECKIIAEDYGVRQLMMQADSKRAIRILSQTNPSLGIDTANIADYEIEAATLRQDTVYALSKLFLRHWKAGLWIGLLFTLQELVGISNGFATGPSIVLFGIIAISGFAKMGRYNTQKLDKLVSNYRGGEPLPARIKAKFKEKDFH
jgi:hypothetical protein